MNGEPSKDFKTRLDAARQWRNDVRSKIEAVYRFCAPGREKEFSNSRRTVEETSVYTSLAEEMATDLAGDLINYYTPPEAAWYSLAVDIPAEAPREFEDAVREVVTAREEDLAGLIAKSNYNDIAPQVWFEAASHGTMAMWVEKAHLAQPVFCEAVPPAELLITPGHLGILDRFREKTVAANTLDVLFDGMDATFPEPLRQKMKKHGASCVVVWGFWADWSDPGRPQWKMEVTVDGKTVIQPRELGDLAGSCPLLVGRFNPQPGHPWGRGAGVKALPDLRVLDKIEEVVLTALDGAVLDTIIYQEDGVLDLSEGLEHGRAYPAGPRFSRDSFAVLPKDAKLDYGWTTKEAMEARIRSAFYQDGPRQRGDTPPTAAQWFDERRRVQQRLGKPSAPLWTEFGMCFIQRVEKLGIDAGALDPQLAVDGNVITASPISPLQKAQNRDQVMISRSNLELAAMASPEGPQVFVDLVPTFKNIVRASGDPLTVIREEEKPVAAPPV